MRVASGRAAARAARRQAGHAVPAAHACLALRLSLGPAYRDLAPKLIDSRAYSRTLSSTLSSSCGSLTFAKWFPSALIHDVLTARVVSRHEFVVFIYFVPASARSCVTWHALSFPSGNSATTSH